MRYIFLPEIFLGNANLICVLWRQIIAITLIVRGSANAQSVEESQQAAVFLILPVILPIAGQFTGVFLMNVWILLGLGVICAILAWFLLQKSMGRFTYEKLLQ